MNIAKLALLTSGLVLAGASMAQYDANKVRLLAHVPFSSMPGSPSSGAGGSGWVSPNGREYGVMGVRTGAVIYDITNPTAPELMKFIPGSTSLWHENVCMGTYAYLVSDQSGSGVQIVDLSAMDTTRTATLVNTYSGHGLSTVHTIQANPQTNTLYLNGSNRGCVFLDASNPADPVEVGRWTTKYVHDSLPVNYTSGPYAGKEILFACCGQDGLYILDVTNKAAPVVIGSTRYLLNGTYCHSGTLTPDKKYFLINDEFDENQGSEPDCTTHVINVENLANPVETTTFHNPLRIIDHNSKWQDGYLVLAAYRGGVRIYDPSDPLHMSETGYFDTYGGPDDFSYDGDWGLYTAYPSGNVILTDIDDGFFVVDPSEAKNMGAPIVSYRTSTPPARTFTVKTLRLADGITYSMHLVRGSAFVELGYQTTSKVKNLLDITVKGQTSMMRATLMLLNKSTGQFDRLGTQQLNATNSTVTFANVAASNYIKTDGSIRARVQFDSFTPQGIIDLDMVKATVH